jgi:GxxExxY protein
LIKNEYKYSELTEAIIGAAMEVHAELGCGFPEIIYQRALAIEFKLREIPHKQEPELEIFYKGNLIGKRRADFLTHDLLNAVACQS